jgi:hypothetical protein
MQRYHHELGIIRKRLREAGRLGKSLPCGYYRKRDAHDCGRPCCGICHVEERFGHIATRQERAAELRMSEQVCE